MSYINNDLKNNEKYYKKYLKYKNKYNDISTNQEGSGPLLSSAAKVATGMAIGYLTPKVYNYLSNKSNSDKVTKPDKVNEPDEEYISLFLPVDSANKLLNKINNSYKICKSEILTLLNGNYSLIQQPPKLVTVVFNKKSKDNNLQIVNINNTAITTATTKESLLTLINQSVIPKKAAYASQNNKIV